MSERAQRTPGVYRELAREGEDLVFRTGVPAFVGYADGASATSPKGAGAPVLEGAACDVADDNVIDFCFPPGDAAAAIDLPPDVARDRQGLASAAGRLELPT